MIAWVEALRDDNPIHRDPATSAALGFGPRTVNPGPTNLAYVLNMIAQAFPGDHPCRLEARFLGNVLAGDDVAVSGRCIGDGQVEARLTVPARGETVLDVVVTGGLVI